MEEVVDGGFKDMTLEDGFGIAVVLEINPGNQQSGQSPVGASRVGPPTTLPTTGGTYPQVPLLALLMSATLILAGLALYRF